MKRITIWIFPWGGLLAGSLYADRHKISRDLADKLGQPDVAVDVIVEFQSHPTDADFAVFTASAPS